MKENELPLWKGRRGLVNTVACCALALPCAWGLWLLAERSVIIPACTRYARSQGLAYADFRMVGVKHASTVVCVLVQDGGKTSDVYLDTIVPFITNLLTEFAMSPEFTVPAFAIALAILRVALYRLGTRTET